MNKINQFRHKHNLSQRKLAEMLGVNIRSVQRWESGDREPRHMVFKLLEEIELRLKSRLE